MFIKSKNNNYKKVARLGSWLLLFSIGFPIEIDILSYNIHGLPTVFGKEQKQKIRQVINKSASHQIIFYQENWIYQNKLFKNMLMGHSSYVGKESKYPKKLQKILNPNGSGLTTCVRKTYKVLSYKEILFKDCSGYINKFNDCLASKGFQAMTILLPGPEKVDLYNLHLDAGEALSDKKARKNQVNALSQYIKQTGMLHPIIIAGDFNMTLEDQDSTLYDFCKEFSFFNKHIESDLSIVDYIFIKSSTSLKINIVDYYINKEFMGMSDHPAISVKLTFESVK